jgi:excisionase family DNA binding protein
VADTNTRTASRILTAEEVAEEFKISKQLISKLVKMGELPAIRIGSLLRFRESDLQEFLERHLQKPPSKEKREFAPGEALLRAESLQAVTGKRFTHQIIGRTPLDLDESDPIKVDWGDETNGTAKYNPEDGTIRASHAYAAPGVYTFTLVVKHQGVTIQVQEKIHAQP